jgi:hypothetical protein
MLGIPHPWMALTSSILLQQRHTHIPIPTRHSNQPGSGKAPTIRRGNNTTCRDDVPFMVPAKGVTEDPKQ